MKVHNIKKYIERRKDLRVNATETEKLLWNEVKFTTHKKNMMQTETIILLSWAITPLE